MASMGPSSTMNVTAGTLREVISSVGRGKSRGRGWFTRIVTSYLHYRDAHRAAAPAAGARPEAERALRVIQISCIKSAVGGMASGLVTTGATLFASEELGSDSLLIAVPAAIIGVAAEMVARTLINLDMTCDLADIFGVHLDPADPTDVWQLYSLAFETHAETSDDELVKEVEKVDA